MCLCFQDRVIDGAELSFCQCGVSSRLSILFVTSAKAGMTKTDNLPFDKLNSKATPKEGVA